MAQTQQSGELLKQSTNYTRVFFYGTTGQTLTINLSKAGAAFGASTNSASEIANGWYKIILAAADVSVLGDLAYHITGGAGGPLDFQDQVVSQLASDIALNINGQVIAASALRQNVALNAFSFVMTDSVNHAPATGKTVTAQRSLGGAGFSPCANSPIELSNGVYVINLAAADLNSPTVTLRFTATGCDDRVIELVTQP